MALPDGTRLMLMAPMVRGRRGEHEDVLTAIRKAGFLRARIDGEVVEVSEPPKLVRQKTHHIEAIVDRVIIRPAAGVRERLAESIKLALSNDTLTERAFQLNPAIIAERAAYERVMPQAENFYSSLLRR